MTFINFNNHIFNSSFVNYLNISFICQIIMLTILCSFSEWFSMTPYCTMIFLAYMTAFLNNLPPLSFQLLTCYHYQEAFKLFIGAE